MVLEKGLIRLIEKTLSRNFLGEDYTLTKCLATAVPFLIFRLSPFQKHKRSNMSSHNSLVEET